MLRKRRQAGQVGLTVLLITVVLVTVGVAVASRSVSELRLTRQEEETTRALNIAESGVESLLENPETLISIEPTGMRTIGSKNFNYEVSELKQFSAPVAKGHVVDVNLEGYRGTFVKISWPMPSPVDCINNPEDIAALEISLFSDSGGAASVSRKAYDWCNTRSNFDLPNTSMTFWAQVGVDNVKLLRIKAYFSGTTVSVAGDGTNELPPQGYTVKAQAAEGGDNLTRAVQVDKTQGSLPSVFDYVLFSGTNIVKN